MTRVFRMATWFRVVAIASALLLVVCGGYLLIREPGWFYRASGAVLAVVGIGGVLDTLVSKIVLDTEAVHVIGLVRRRTYARADFASAKVDGGAVCLKRHDGGWLILPGTGHNSLSVRNTVHAWIKAGQK